MMQKLRFHKHCSASAMITNERLCNASVRAIVETGVNTIGCATNKADNKECEQKGNISRSDAFLSAHCSASSFT